MAGRGDRRGEITSIRSPRVKAARQLARRSARQRTRLFLAEGPQAVREALAGPGEPGSRGNPGAPDEPHPRGAAGAGLISELFVTAAARSRYGELITRAAGRGAAVHAVSGEVMAELARPSPRKACSPCAGSSMCRWRG